MPITYVGRSTNCVGKPLFHILLNLKNYGIGRMFIRGSLKRYAEPTYYVIRRVHPIMDEKNLFGVVWAEQVFRGRKVPGLQRMHCSYKADWQLVPRDEEEKYYSLPVEEVPVRVRPKYKLLPPVMEMSLRQQMQMKGKNVEDELKMEMVYKEDIRFYRVETVEERPLPSSYTSSLKPEFLVGIKNIEK
ncbi:uncharacterized protein mRpS34 [Centruroides vittatus]|uniref:uncharacterized protein mRpS34 n=1 Tax=Centruroides vittatus TaxID=120091 RepID=UPI00351093B6